MKQEILNVVKEKGILLERDVFNLVNNIDDPKIVRQFLESLELASTQKMITKKFIESNYDYMKVFLASLEDDKKEIFSKFFNFNEQKKEEKEIVVKNTDKKEGLDYKIFYADTKPDKKIDLKDFVGHFRARYSEIQRILMGRPELSTNLVSINKISSERTSLSIIGIVTEKRITKNKNMVISFEDLTGKIGGIVKVDNEELFSKADELQLDDIVGVKASGNRDLLFIHDIIFPDAFLHEKTRFNEDISIAFLSDLHVGSDRHLGNSLNNFLNWINSDDEVARKIKYIFFVGDNVDGVGVFPGQDKVLKLKSMNEQYGLLASYLKKIPKNITMFMCPGQHDATRVHEPQPIISKKYAPDLYEVENLTLVTNPTLVKLLEGEKEFKVLMYHGASIHNYINEIKELRLMKAHRCPAKAVKHMLKRRHLASSHGVSTSIVYIPNAEKDPLVISEVPDVLCTGEVHRLDIENYNGVLIVTGSCWQAQTPFEEKVGNIPDPCKVPVLNLKSGELRIFDFGIEEEIKRNYNEGKEVK